MAREPQQDIAWGYMLAQHQGKANLEALVKSYFTPNTTLTTALDRMCTALDLDTAFGEHLDYLGSIVGVSRDLPLGLFMAYFGFASQPAGRAFNTMRMRRDGEAISTSYTAGDAEYKTLIKLKILMNNARGTTPEVIDAVRSVFGDPNLPVSVRQNGTAAATINIGKIPLAEDPIPQLLVDRVPRAAGVAFTHVYYAPYLDADFTKMVAPPGMTFARANTGSYWNNAGVLVLAAVNGPRFEYNRETGVPEGLLTEPLTTATSRQSNAINAWVLTNATAVANGANDPYGAATAEVLVVATGMTEGSGQIETASAGNARYTNSVYVQDAGWAVRCASAGSRGYIRFECVMRDDPTKFAFIEVWMDNGEVKQVGGSSAPDTTNGPTNAGVHMHRGPNANLYRPYFEWTAGAVSTDRVIQRVKIMSASAAVTGDGTVGVLVYGANSVNKQWVPPSLINSTTANGTRNSDVVTFALASQTWANLQAMTIVAEFKLIGSGINGSTNLFGFNNGGGMTDACAVRYRQLASGRPNSMFVDAQIIGNDATQWSYAIANNPDTKLYMGQISRAAIGFSLTGAAFAVNGKVIAKKTDGLIIPRLTGGNAFWNITDVNGPPIYLRRLKVYPKLLTDAELIEATSSS